MENNSNNPLSNFIMVIYPYDFDLYDGQHKVLIDALDPIPEKLKEILKVHRQLERFKTATDTEIYLFMLQYQRIVVDPLIEDLKEILIESGTWLLIEKYNFFEDFIIDAKLIIVNALFLDESLSQVLDKILLLLKEFENKCADKHSIEVLDSLERTDNVPRAISQMNDIAFKLKWRVITPKNLTDGWSVKIHEFYTECIEYLKVKHNFKPLQTVIEDENQKKPKKPKKPKSNKVEMKDLFQKKYQDRFHLFFDVLKQEPYKYINEDNEWIIGANAYKYYGILKNDSTFKVIKDTIATTGSKITDTMSAECFLEYFKLNEATFKKKLELKDDEKIIFLKAINSVVLQFK